MGDDYNILNLIKSTKSDTYKVPEGYFENLSESILLKIQSKNTTFGIPNGYFEGLSNSILAKIKQQEIENEITAEISEFAPMLASLQQKQVYTVPDNYFTHLTINAPVKKEVKIVQLKTRFTFIKYAAAAVIVTVIAFGGFFNNQATKQSLAMYHQAKQIDVEKSINQISDKELNKVLEEEQLLAYQSTNTTTSLPWKNLDNLDEEIQYVTDKEIDAYIAENNISTN
jgi:hypothetical protein